MNSGTSAAGICFFVLSATISGQPPASARDGIYTDEQAARGKVAYAKDCASCHGETLEGRGQTPPLAGTDFLSNWNSTTVGELFQKMQDSMPADRPGQLTKERNAEILAYMLQVNKFPVGKQELPANADALKNIRMSAEKNK
jgi:S-disulfanyl-L-cysteine oxidoreductase SoxD